MLQTRITRIAATILALMLATAARAEWQILPRGPGVIYLGGEGGWTRLASEHAMATIPVIGFRSDPQTWHDGLNVGARGGYELGPWRLEEEFRYQRNSDKKLETSGGSGNYFAEALLSNLIYDFTPGWFLSPHIGAGIGAVRLSSSLNVTGLGQTITGSDWVFGYQAIGGVRYLVNPSVSVDLDYRYLGTTTPHFRTGSDFVDGGVPAPGITVASGYQSHSILASLSLRFGAPPPAPVVAAPAPPAPPPVMREVFLVFFDWDRDTITPEGMQIVQAAANAFHAGAPVTIQVTGYTDRSGSPGYNQRLSERRANNVANALVRLGVPKAQMSVGGRGENDNRVPTADGVREPQNRRVEIVSS